eukprot:1767313-Pyramimonas_sp.AAC.1
MPSLYSCWYCCNTAVAHLPVKRQSPRDTGGRHHRWLRVSKISPPKLRIHCERAQDAPESDMFKQMCVSKLQRTSQVRQ